MGLYALGECDTHDILTLQQILTYCLSQLVKDMASVNMTQNTKIVVVNNLNLVLSLMQNVCIRQILFKK